MPVRLGLAIPGHNSEWSQEMQARKQTFFQAQKALSIAGQPQSAASPSAPGRVFAYGQEGGGATPSEFNRVNRI